MKGKEKTFKTLDEQIDILLEKGLIIDDIYYAIGSKEIHFLGAIITKKDSKGPNRELIDGQQRLTTIYVLMCSLVYLLKKHKVE